MKKTCKNCVHFSQEEDCDDGPNRPCWIYLCARGCNVYVHRIQGDACEYWSDEKPKAEKPLTIEEKLIIEFNDRTDDYIGEEVIKARANLVKLFDYMTFTKDVRLGRIYSQSVGTELDRKFVKLELRLTELPSVYLEISDANTAYYLTPDGRRGCGRTPLYLDSLEEK